MVGDQLRVVEPLTSGVLGGWIRSREALVARYPAGSGNTSRGLRASLRRHGGGDGDGGRSFLARGPPLRCVLVEDSLDGVGVERLALQGVQWCQGCQWKRWKRRVGGEWQ
jgi:hypothetical protein